MDGWIMDPFQRALFSRVDVREQPPSLLRMKSRVDRSGGQTISAAEIFTERKEILLKVQGELGARRQTRT